MLVDVRTDVTPNGEFDEVRVTVDDHVVQRTLAELGSDADWIAAVRVAEFPGLEPATRDVRVELLLGGAVVIARSVRVVHREARVVNVVLTRSCVGVTCEDAAAPSCLAGRCVAPDCVTGSEPTCPAPECTSDETCQPAADCGAVRCEEGTCLYLPMNGCANPEAVCDPRVGCVLTDGSTECGASCACLDGPCDITCRGDCSVTCEDDCEVECAEGTATSPATTSPIASCAARPARAAWSTTSGPATSTSSAAASALSPPPTAT